MSEQQLPLTRPPHGNQRLFSDHYLDEILPALPGWQMLASAAKPALQQIAAIFARFKPSANEAQTEQDLVRPVLASLGHTFEVQAPLATPHGAKKPDYVFYGNQAALDANKGVTLDESRLGAAFAVGDAKHWDRPLDASAKGKASDPLEWAAPSFQIAFYVQHSGVPWGILTNGRLWRLYHRDTAHKLDRYYQVDLKALVETGDPARFLYFYAFFSRAAFGGAELGVDAILRASLDYAHGVGESVKQQVYDALRHLAQGFFDHPANELASNPETLQAIHDSSLILLYRLLFILYAEARELLPVREGDSYRDHYSLRAIAREVARDLDRASGLLTSTTTVWSRLRTLFELIDRGSLALKIGTFDGGLFDPKRHPFLEQHAVGDARLQRAIDRLARVGGHFVDYRDLSERHLGAIYEGLLEFHLVEILPEGAWTVDLVNDKGERKATGSYYTPDYVVKYIVEQAVGPVLRAAVAGKQTDAEKIRAVLDVKVCDPAMGSGHFPVEVTEYVARFLVEQAVTPTGETAEGDLAYWKRRVAQSCVYGVDLNPLAVDLAKLSLWLATAAKDKPLSFLDHHLRPGNAVVGAWVSDLRPHVATAKLSKRAKQEAEQAAAGQLSMLDDDAFRQSMSTAVSSMWLIEGRPGNTLADVKEQEEIYATLRAELYGKYERLANLTTATHFGVTVDAALLKPLVDYATGRAVAEVPRFKEWLDASMQAAARYRFFHWELEFPEVFFDRHGRSRGERAGFDAVVGNPPYVRQELLSPVKSFLAAEYASFDSVADLYVYFYERGVRLLNAGGRLAYISSGTFARANFAKPFRQFLPSAAHLESVVDFGEMVRPSIVVLAKGPADGIFRSLLIADKVPASLEQAVAQQGVDCDPTSLDLPEWTFQPSSATRLLAKLLDVGRPLREIAAGRMFRGVLTGLNEAFVVDGATRRRLIAEDPDSSSILKKFLQGQDLRPWYQEDADRWLIFTRRGTDIDRIPSIRSYLEPFHARLQPKPESSNGVGGAPGRKPGSYLWYEIQDTVDYHAEFAELKIVWPDISKLPRFSWDVSGTLIGNTGYFVAGASPAVLGILQSRPLWFAISQICQPLRLRAGLWQYRLFPQFMERLPVPDLADDQRRSLGDLALRISALARERYDLHRRARHRVLVSLGKPGRTLNQKLTAWWSLDFTTFRAEVKGTLGADIPVKQHDEWETWLAERRDEHERLTAEIVQLETALNARVYALFDLSQAEIALIEASTKYRYGEV